MLFGVCCGYDDFESLKYIKDAGFDYVEYNFGALSRMSEEDFLNYEANLIKADIPCRAANCFLPGEFKVGAGEYNKKEVAEYIEIGMKRGARIGMKTVAFGSGGARSKPQTMQYRESFLNISRFLENIVAPIAEKYGIRVVIEPLRFVECNIINTVKEGAMLAASAKSENIGVLADIYHMVCENDSFKNIIELKGILHHAHISYPYGISENVKRSYPKSVEEFDYKAFVNALCQAECKSCSIEAGTDNFREDAANAIKVLREI